MSSRRVLGGLVALSAATIGFGGAVALGSYWRQRQWLASLDLHRDSAFSFPLVRTEGVWLPLDMYKGQQAAKDMSFSEEDVIVASFPKSGTTWLQEIVYLLMHDLNFIKAGGSNMEERFPYLEYIYPGPAELSSRPPPRLLKTHLPAHLLPPEARRRARIICIVRDPKDVLVSYYHFAQMFAPAGYTSDVADFKQRFLRTHRLPYAPWREHVRSYIAQQQQQQQQQQRGGGGGNVLLVTYEALSRRPHAEVRRIERFLGRPRPLSEADLDRLVRHCSFEAMSANPACNYAWWDVLGLRRASGARFMREGRVGGWRRLLSEAEAEEVDEMVREAGLEGLWRES